MFSLFKKNKIKLEIPKWAAFFKEDEYDRFLKAVENYFYSKNVTYVLGDGLLDAGPNDFGFGVLGLVNIAQLCKLEENRGYSEIVSSHFEALIRNYQFDKEFDKLVEDFESVREYIAVRLYQADYIPEIAKDVSLQKDFVGDIIMVLVFDLPDAIESITSDVANKWPLPLEELFEIGIKNVKNKFSYDISKQQFNDFSIWFVQADHFFTPNILFDFDRQQQLTGTKGSLIGVPHRHAVIVYPIETIQVVEAINALIPTIRGMNEEGPGSISNNLFWYKDGHYENLPYEMADNKIQFYPTKGFMSVLDSLGLEE